MKIFTFNNYLFWVFLFFAPVCVGQITYFEQDFNGPGPFVNPSPGTGEFSQFVESRPDLSYIRFQNGAMEMIRTSGSNGGSVSAIRSVPFSPNPETLYIQITLTVKNVTQPGNPAAYFYIGENFVTSQLPNNNALFSRPSIRIEPNGFIIRDVSTNRNSSLLPFNTPVLITWVLNNSSFSTVYKMPESAPVANKLLGSQRFDLWVNNEQVVSGGASYTPYSSSKLSNMQIRFLEGVGTISIDNLRIRDVDGVLPVHLSNFEAKLKEERVQLNWQVDSLMEYCDFLVERSEDDIEFEQIGRVVSDSGPKEEFQFVDQKPLPGVTYYRITLIGRDGTFLAQSGVRDIVFKSAGAIYGVWPNPIEGSNIIFYHGGRSVGDFKLRTVTGSIVPAIFRNTSQGRAVGIPFTKLSPGIYLLTYMDQGFEKTNKVLVIDQ